MGQVLLLLVVALTVAAVVFGVTVLVTGSDPGLDTAEPDGRAVPLPGNRPLLETDVGQLRFDLALRGYRMAQVDQALRRAAYDIGYKDELIGVLQAEVTALREGRLDDAEALRRAREAALVPVGAGNAAPDAPLYDATTGTSPAGATTAGIGIHASPVPPVGGPTRAAGSGGSANPADPAEPGALEFPRVEFGPGSTAGQRADAEPVTGERTTEPAGGQSATGQPADGQSATGQSADGQSATGQSADGAPASGSVAATATSEERAESADPAAPTRPVRRGGSVIEAEDGDLTESSTPIRPAAGGGSGDPTGAGASEQDRPAQTDADNATDSTTTTDATATDTDTDDGDGPAGSAPAARLGRPMQADGAAGANGPAEQPERA